MKIRNGLLRNQVLTKSRYTKIFGFTSDFIKIFVKSLKIVGHTANGNGCLNSSFSNVYVCRTTINKVTVTNSLVNYTFQNLFSIQIIPGKNKANKISRDISFVTLNVLVLFVKRLMATFTTVTLNKYTKIHK